MLEFPPESNNHYRISEFYCTSAQSVVTHGGTYKRLKLSNHDLPILEKR